MSRIYRSAPLNSIWEGSGNVMCLDILRAAPSSLPSLMKEIFKAKGQSSTFDIHLNELSDFIKRLIQNTPTSGGLSLEVQRGARELAERLAIALQASILIRFGNATVCHLFFTICIIIILQQTADVFIESRIRSRNCGLSLGSYCIDKKNAEKLIRSNFPVN
jgi:hypothetical protein